MLSTLAVLFIRSFRNVPIARGNVIVSLYLIVIYGVLMLDYFGVLDFDILTVNIITFIFIVVYALAVRHLSGETEAPDEDCQEEVGLSLNQIIVRFIIASIAIIGLSIVLTYITDDIAVGSNLFNFLVLCIADIVSLRQSVYDYADPNVVKLLMFGALATLFTVPMLKFKGWAVRVPCALCIVACYLAFLLVEV